MTKVTNLDKIISDATTIIDLDQYNSHKQNLQKKIGDVHNKVPI